MRAAARIIPAHALLIQIRRVQGSGNPVLTSELTVTRSTIEILPGGIMSVSKVSILFVLLALAFLVACGGSSGTVTNPTPPPSGGFSNAVLNGTYVFSVAGTDEAGAPYALAGTFTANGSGGSGSGGITAGTLDINDTDTTEFTAGPVADVSVSSGSSYSISVDGRGIVTLNTNIGNGFPALKFDLVMQDSSHGLITEFDSFASGSGTLDLQSSTTTPSGSYAFTLSGVSYGGAVWISGGNFAYSGGTISGLEDLNEGGAVIYSGVPLGGALSVNASSPATSLVIPAFPNGLVFDAFAIDNTHIKLIEMDTNAALSGDAFSQTSTDLPTGNLAFTLAGELGTGATAAPFAAGGIMNNTSGTVSGTEDYNNGGTLSPSTPGPFTATFTTGGTGRFTLSNFTTFLGGTTYAAYPSSGGLLLVELDSGGLSTGAAYAQTSTTFSTSAGYGLNFSGTNLGTATGSTEEVDDIAEFTSASSGSTLTGIIDENYSPQGSPVFDLALSGNYISPSSGRGQLSAASGNNSNTTLLGGFTATFYTVDGTTFPFIEMDNGQVATGVFVQQSSSAASGSISRQSRAMYVPHPIVHAHAAKRNNQ